MPIIDVYNVSKRYRKGQTGYHTLREDLYNLSGSLFHLRKERLDADDKKHIWALRDVSFEIKQGEQVGIIGRNGSGKTTLLRLLAGITRPTLGKITISGRLGALIEIMAGFHPELTGRDNIYLNGAIMGMSSKEVKRKFDEIVAFAELEEYIDTPIKRYSSGMHVRLGFAVAAHLDPEILLIDEVLAVGDAAFQKKCVGNMATSVQEGRTIVIVSHNMTTIQELCSRSLWIDQGRVVEFGTTSYVIASYLQSGRGETTTAEYNFAEDPEKDFQLLSARLLNDQNAVTQSFTCDNPVIIDLLCKVRVPIYRLLGSMAISRLDGIRVMEAGSYDTVPNPLDVLRPGNYSIRVTIPARTLAPGDYNVNFNFMSLPKREGLNVTNPIMRLSFRLDDVTTMRGNQRTGFFSTKLPWDVTPL